MKRVWLGVIALLMIALAVFFYASRYYNLGAKNWSFRQMTDAERTYMNYKDSVLIASKEYRISQEYLLALITLECSGRKVVPKRFEKHVYRKLKQVQSGKSKTFESVTTKRLKGLSDDALRNLASSWGPFQIMGYKCFDLGVYVADIRGENAVHYGTKWINNNYGKYLKKKKFKDAFHMHNAGKPYPAVGPPKTHNSTYVPRGLELMTYFKKRLLEENGV